jgi:hypothetical protein
MLRAVSLTAALIVLTSVPARAADPPASSEARPLLSAAIDRAAKESLSDAPAWAVDRPERRPATLPVLYGTYATLQVLDLVSTKRALAGGASEVNPLLKSGSSARAIALKAAAGAGTIFFTERAWKKNRVGAIVLMAALNGATAAIVARNAHHAAR